MEALPLQTVSGQGGMYSQCSIIFEKANILSYNFCDVHLNIVHHNWYIHQAFVNKKVSVMCCDIFASNV